MGRKRHVFVWILIIVMLMTLEYFLCDKFLNKKVDKECPICEKCDNNKKEEVDTENNNCDEDLKELDQALFTGIGMIFVSRNGDVYYEPKAYNDPLTTYDDNNLLEMAKKSYGESQKIKIDSEQIFNMSLEKDKKYYETMGYKLELSNIKNVFYSEYGKNNSNYVLAFVSYNGKVSIIKLENNEFTQPKKLSEYSNIVSVVKSTSETGTGLIFIDKCGNKYYYAP